MTTQLKVKAVVKAKSSTKADVPLKKVVTPTVRKGTKSEVSMVCAAGEECFWSNDGQVLSSLGDLMHALKHMSAETYAHHVTVDRNDFADWVGVVLSHKTCAADIRKAKTQKATIEIIAKAIPSPQK